MLRVIRAWSRRSHLQAVANARAAAVVCARSGVERREIELFLLARSERRDVLSVTRHPA